MPVASRIVYSTNVYENGEDQMTSEIEKLHQLLLQLPPDEQCRVVPSFIGIVEWLAEPEGDDDTGAEGTSSSIGISFSRSRSTRNLGFD